MYDVFALPEIKFPAGFLWGSATAGHQIEGDNVNSQWWHREQKGETRHKSGKACNHYELYKQDIDLVRELGHQAFRLSIEWSRIEPTEGHWDEAALAHYLDELELLKARGIQVFLTLHHYTHPQWFEDLGQFYKYENLKYFERFVNYVVPKVAPFVDNWHVFNEFNHVFTGDRKLNMIRAHALGYHIIKQHSQAWVSTAHAFIDFFPTLRYDKFDNIAAEYQDWSINEFFFHAIRTGELIYPQMEAIDAPDVKGAIDYWAVNTYIREMANARVPSMRGPRFVHKNLKMISHDFYLGEMFPESMITLLDRIRDKPVIITENGCSCNDDRFRIVWLALHLCALKEAMDRGVDVRGYLYWSLMDNFEWGSFDPRFGLVHVDFETFARTPRPSASFFRDIIQHNGVTPAMIRKYLKELPTLEQ
jgi:beta-glucosidase